MNFKIPVIAILATLTTPAIAQVSLTLPKTVEVLVVNGVVTEDQHELTLEDGNNQIVFKYNTSFRLQGQQKRFTSEAVILTFNSQDAALKLSLPRLRSESDADNFNKRPEMTLTDEADAEVQYKSDLLLKEGIQLGRDYDIEIAAYNTSSAPAVLPNLVEESSHTPSVLPATALTASEKSVPTKDTSIAAQKNSVEKEQINVGQMLDFWYSQADEETRKAFKQRIEK
ncbi:DUF2057 domain-containing protein [Shewanella sp. UCD-KL12]|uniref:YccT family protein n=1 Tax=Shewanella sp. UCD-KL12 TaxID=1917163 RepID=UPI0009711D7D|nr:DUF2057 domain-containing protein [Shewanella sp. UCD-KL12]